MSAVARGGSGRLGCKPVYNRRSGGSVQPGAAERAAYMIGVGWNAC
jgi:hypothetical protein